MHRGERDTNTSLFIPVKDPMVLGMDISWLSQKRLDRNTEGKGGVRHINQCRSSMYRRFGSEVYEEGGHTNNCDCILVNDPIDLGREVSRLPDKDLDGNTKERRERGEQQMNKCRSSMTQGCQSGLHDEGGGTQTSMSASRLMTQWTWEGKIVGYFLNIWIATRRRGRERGEQQMI